MADDDGTDLDPVITVDAYTTEKNIATNGRLFSAMLFSACLVAYFVTHREGFFVLALGAAAPVGISCIIDQMEHGEARLVASIALYALPVVVTLFALLNLR